MPKRHAAHDIERPAPIDTARMVLYATVALLPLVWFVYTFFYAPKLTAAYEAEGIRSAVAHGVRAFILTLAAAFGVATLFSILVLNHARLGRLFRPTRAKVITAIVLALVIPIGLVGAFPVNLVAVILTALGAFPDLAARAVSQPLPSLVAILPVLFVSYVFASAVIYGIRNHGVRIALLTATWIAAYAFLVLSTGIRPAPA